MTADFDEFSRRWKAGLQHVRENADPRWRMTAYRGHETSDGVAWVADIRLDGKVVGHAEDSGRGGAIDLTFLDDRGWTGPTRDLWNAEVARLIPEGDPESALFIEGLLLRAGF